MAADSPLKHCQFLLVDACVEPTLVSAGRTAVNVSALLLTNKGAEVLSCSTGNRPPHRSVDVHVVNSADALDELNPDSIGQIYLNLDSIQVNLSDVNAIVLTLTQQDTASIGRIKVRIALNRADGMPCKEAPLLLGDFDPAEAEAPDSYVAGITEITAVIILTPDGWGLIPVRQLRPHFSIEAQLGFARSILDEIDRYADEQGAVHIDELVADAVVPPPEELAKFGEETVPPREMTPPLQIPVEREPNSQKETPNKLPPSKAARRKSATSENPSDGVMRAYETDVENVVGLLKSPSTEFSELADNLYAEPWLDELKEKDSLGLPVSTSSEGTESVASSVQRAVLVPMLESVKRQIRSEFLETLRHFRRKDDDAEELRRDNILLSRIHSTQRDLQRMQQEQQETRKLLADCSTMCMTLMERTSGSCSLSTAKLDEKRQGKNLLQDFKDFTLCLEKVSQVIGASFRTLQQELHYPEAFKDLAKESDYATARKLLEFVSCKKATNLVEDIETLAGIWRAAGADIPADPMAQPAPMKRATAVRRSWWTPRPFDYNQYAG